MALPNSKIAAWLAALAEAGIEATEGDIVGVLNADDYYVSNDVLAAVADVFRDPGVDACYGDLEYVAAGNTERVVRSWKAGNFGRDRFYHGWMPPHPSLFFRRTV